MWRLILLKIHTLALLQAKLDEAKWRVACDCKQIKIQVCNQGAQVPTLVLYKQSNDCHVRSYTMQFDEEGFLLGVVGFNTEAEEALLSLCDLVAKSH